MSITSFPSVGTDERYEVVLPLAKGGMGTVELVVRRTEDFERLYALKRLHPHLRDDDELVKMFLDEARVGGRIRHANVVSVLDVGKDAGGPYFVMDYVEGRSVRDVLKASIAASRPVPIQVCVRIAAQAAAGLHSAHELTDRDGQSLNLVHRDVSPQNIIVGFDGTSRLTDFGIAKVYGASTQTSTGILKGKKGYTSPEQLRLETLDRRSDLFSLGIVLFELLGGRKLYSGSPETVMLSILHKPPPDIGEIRRDIPPALSELLFRLLAKDREHRPATAREVAETLQAILADLVAEEGTVSVSAFMAEIFAGERDVDDTKIRAALARLTKGPAVATPAPASKSARRPTRGVVVGVGIAVVSLALGVGLTIVATGSGSNTAGPPTTASSPVDGPALAPTPSVPTAVANGTEAVPTDASVVAVEAPQFPPPSGEGQAAAADSPDPAPAKVRAPHHRGRSTGAARRSKERGSGRSPSPWGWPGTP